MNQVTPLLHAINEFKDVVDSDSMNFFRVFLLVMQEPGRTQKSITEAMPDVDASGSVSNIIRILGKFPGKEGKYDLLQTEDDPDDRRLKRVRLTPNKGERLAQKIAVHLGR